MVMNRVRLAAILVLLAQPASAQMNLLGTTEKPKTLEEIEKREAQEKAYKESLKKIPEQKAANDPWGDVRNAGAPASGKAQQKPK
jgi:hypothetical protein